MVVARTLMVGLVVLALTACANERAGKGDFASSPEAIGAPPGAQLAMTHDLPSVPAGFRAVAEASLDRPTALAADDTGGVIVAVAGNQLLRLGPDGSRDLITEGAAGARFTGVVVKGSVAFVTAVGAAEGGQVLRVERDGRTVALMENLPTGLHSVAAPAVGPDGAVYLGIGSATAAGIAEQRGPHDIPCENISLSGRNFAGDDSHTGAFVPQGRVTSPGQVITGQVPCTSAVLRLDESGGRPQLVAWGFADPRSLAFTPDGRLYLLDGSNRSEGLRTLTGGGDMVFAVSPGVWYGWPDVRGTQAMPPPLIANAPNPPPKPLAEFAAWSQAMTMDIARAGLFGGPDQAYLAVAVPPRGFRVVRLDLKDGTTADFANFPDGFPAALRFDPAGESLYVLERGGTLWRIARDVPVA